MNLPKIQISLFFLFFSIIGFFSYVVKDVRASTKGLCVPDCTFEWRHDLCPICYDCYGCNGCTVDCGTQTCDTCTQVCCLTGCKPIAEGCSGGGGGGGTSTPTPTPTPTPSPTPAPTPTPGPPATFPPGAGIKAEVVVYWTDSRGRHEVRSVTYFTDWRER